MLLVFVGLLVGQQVLEDGPKRHGCSSASCPRRQLGQAVRRPGRAADRSRRTAFAGIAWTEITGGDAGNWGATGVGIHMMASGGGEWFCLIFTSLFCFCIDRQFLKATVLSFAAMVAQATTGLVSMWNEPTTKLGPEKMGFYSADKDMNFGWMWSVALAMSTVFFLLHFGLQKMGMIEGPIEDAPTIEKGIAITPASAPLEVVADVAPKKEESEA